MKITNTHRHNVTIEPIVLIAGATYTNLDIEVYCTTCKATFVLKDEPN